MSSTLLVVDRDTRQCLYSVSGMARNIQLDELFGTTLLAPDVGLLVVDVKSANGRLDRLAPSLHTTQDSFPPGMLVLRLGKRSRTLVLASVCIGWC